MFFANKISGIIFEDYGKLGEQKDEKTQKQSKLHKIRHYCRNI
jgi:hypothetical protein